MYIRVWIEQPHPDRGLYKESRDDAIKVCERIADTPTVIKQIIILDKKMGHISSPLIKKLDNYLILKALLTQHINLGLNMGEAISTLVNFSVKIPSEQLIYSDFNHLREAADICDILFKKNINYRRKNDFNKKSQSVRR